VTAANRPVALRAEECDVCGAADGDLIPMIHKVNHGQIRAHDECGTARGYVADDEHGDACPVGHACLACRTPAPACDMPDGCGAAAGRPCEAGCPSLAADGNELAVSLTEFDGHTLCITRCAACTAEGRWPRLTADAARRMVIDHRGHTAPATRAPLGPPGARLRPCPLPSWPPPECPAPRPGEA
jgi:hypothetical protein